MRELWNCLRLVRAVFLARLFPRMVIVLVIATGVLAVVLSRAEDGAGYRALAEAAQLLVAVIAVALAVAASIAIAGDSAQGALRAVLLRPVRRSTVVLAHAVVLAGFALALYLLGILSAAISAGVAIGFGPITLDDFVITESAAMMKASLRLLALPFPSLVALAWLALLASAWIDDLATAIVLGLAVAAGPLLAHLVLGDLFAWSFSTTAVDPLDALEALSRGDTVREAEVLGSHYLTRILLLPLAWAAFALLSAIFAFGRREVSS